MCGIAGIGTRDGSLPSEELLRRMSDAIAHRGPDGEGIWSGPGVGLTHRRLAIIDLSPSGAQPMLDASASYAITFNGEIYNYRELRSELEARGALFRTSSDTEVILEAYRAWGVDCLKRLRGMFAFGLWDGTQKKLLLARDRIGKKPLFYSTTTGGDLVFASELKALAPAVTLTPDLDAVRLFLGLQYVPTPRTGFASVFQLPIGSYGIWDGNQFSVQMYHAWETRVSEEIDLPHALQEIRSKLDEAVKIRQLASDVPVGAFLSGGIDSAAVVAFASKYAEGLQTFTMGFLDGGSFDEREEAAAIAKKFGTDHHTFEARPEHLIELVDELVRHYDSPYADSSALPLWLLARETAKNIKVVLTGDGGDELFGGYRRYAVYEKALRLAGVPFSSSVLHAFGKLTNDPRYLRAAETMGALQAEPLRAYGELFCGSYFSSVRASRTFHRAFLEQTQTADPVSFIASHMVDASLDAAMRFDLTSYLPDDLNVKMDRATMRFGLEARSPFLDQNLMSYACALPLKWKVDHGKKKIALKAAMRGILSEDVLNREKRGFQVPLANWFRGPLAGVLRDRILDPDGPLATFVRLSAVERLIQEQARGADHGNRLWMLFTLSTWLSRYGT